MKLISVIARWILLVIAACSLISMLALLQVDSIVHKSLYSYGLQFSDAWATPYWNSIRVVFAMGWLTFGAAAAFQFYAATRNSSAKNGKFDESEMKQEARWNTYKLGDGSTIKVKLVVKSARRLNRYSDDGMPVYTVETEPVVEVVDVPESLRVVAKGGSRFFCF